MNFREIARQTLSSMRAHKMRFFLTMFGIIWGITSVVLLVGLGRGFNRDQKRRHADHRRGPGHHLGRAHQYGGRRVRAPDVPFA